MREIYLAYHFNRRFFDRSRVLAKGMGSLGRPVYEENSVNLLTVFPRFNWKKGKKIRGMTSCIQIAALKELGGTVFWKH